ncbi:hypothetical protein AGQ48_24675 [Salmonella enterica subsp. enterica]|nr:hypothetical protein AGQ48_24675 [Salmonella enterica subsp. enterica]
MSGGGVSTAGCRWLRGENRVGEMPRFGTSVGGGRWGVGDGAGVGGVRRGGGVEGVLLGRVYTGRAMAGLMDGGSQGRVSDDGPVLFIRAGGAPALFGCDPRV